MNENYAVYRGCNNGPSFGRSDLDIWVSGGRNFNKCCCEKSTYEKPIRETKDDFFIEEFEVFQILLT